MRYLIALMGLCAMLTAHAATPVAALRAAALAAAPFTPAEVSLDPRVQVARCEVPLSTEVVNARDRQATVQVRCEAPRWQLYVPVRATGATSVVVLTRPVAANTVIQSADVVLSAREGNASGYGAFDQVEAVVGLHSRRALPAGRVLGPADVIAPPMIRRGDHIAIEIQTSSVRIRMAGEALSDGGYGQRIPVRNSSSGKRLEAIVRSAGTVEVPH